MIRKSPTTANSKKLESRLAEFSRFLSSIGTRGWIGTAHVSQAALPGEFRSRHRTVQGLDRDIPRTYTMDDEPSTIDLRHLPPSLIAHSLLTAVTRGDLRLTQSVLLAESEFITIVDLSRSMLSGCFGEENEFRPSEQQRTKLTSMIQAACAFLAIAERARFTIRAIYAQNGQFHQDRSRSPKDFVQRALPVIKHGLMRSYRQAETDPAAQERFCLAPAILGVLAARVRSVVVIISDFLDPLSQYSALLAEAMSRHSVVLVDVAAPDDFDYPEPTCWDFESQRIPGREGARHLEQGTALACLVREDVRCWNKDRQADRRVLKQLCRKWNGRHDRFWGFDFARCYTQALHCLTRLH